MPHVSFEDGDGVSTDLSAYRGKVILLNVWAIWCGPCREGMPTLDRLQARLGSETFQVVVLSIDRTGPGVVLAFFEDIGIEHLSIRIDQTMAATRLLKVFGLPSTLLIDQEGRELGRLVGPSVWDSPEMIEFLKDMTKKSLVKG